MEIKYIDKKEHLIKSEVVKSHKIFTVLIVLLPILRMYASPIKGINIGEFMLILFVLFISLRKLRSPKVIKTKRREIKLLTLYTSLIFLTLFSALVNDFFSFNDFMIRAFRWGFYTYLVVFGWKWFDFKYGFKVLIYSGIISSLYLFAQIIIYRLTNVILPNVIPGIPNTLGEAFLTRDWAAHYQRVGIRPTSIFLEPARFSYFAVTALVMSLYRYDFFSKKSNKYVVAGILSLAIILSTSTGGLFLMAFVWVFYGYNSIRKIKKRNTALKVAMALCIFIILLPLLANSSPVVSAIEKLAGYDSFGGARVSSYQEYAKMFDTSNYLIGTGMGNENIFVNEYLDLGPQYLSSLSLIFVNFGILGVFAFAMYSFFLIRDSVNCYEKSIAYIFIIACTFSTMMYSPNAIVLWMLYYNTDYKT